MKFTKKHCWYTKTSSKFSKNNSLLCFATYFSFVPTTTQNLHVLSRERTACNVKAWRISPYACVEKILSSSLSSWLLLCCDFIPSLILTSPYLIPTFNENSIVSIFLLNVARVAQWLVTWSRQPRVVGWV